MDELTVPQKCIQSMLNQGFSWSQIRYLAEKIFLDAEAYGPALLAHEILEEWKRLDG
jgi:hypothetical protein